MALFPTPRHGTLESRFQRFLPPRIAALRGTMVWRHQRFFVSVLRLRPALIRASRDRPSTPRLFHSIDRHFLEGQFGGFPVSGIHL